MHIDRPEPMSSADDTIGGRMSLARDARGLSVTAAARTLAIAPDTWAAWENDRAEPLADRLQMIAATLEVSLAWLVSGHGNGPSWLLAGNDNVAVSPG